MHYALHLFVPFLGVTWLALSIEFFVGSILVSLKRFWFVTLYTFFAVFPFYIVNLYMLTDVCINKYLNIKKKFR